MTSGQEHVPAAAAGLEALRRCVGEPQRFGEELWGRRPLHRKSEDDRGFGDLLSLGDVDHLIASSGLRLPAFRLVKDGRTLPSVGHTKTTRTGRHAAPGVADSAVIFREFADGATIVLQGMHRWWAPLARFCRHLELALGHPVQANAYVTPPGAQGLAVHEDEHDVFVLQSHGSKRWRVYERGEGTSGSEPVVRAELRPGDSLYIPGGFPHAASTHEEPSVHVTIGILAATGLSVLREVVKLAEQEAWLAEPLPLRFGDQPALLRDAVRQWLDEIGAWVGKVDPEDIGGRLRRRFLTERQSVLPGQMRQLLTLDALGDRSVVQRRDTALCAVTVADGELSVLLGDRELRMPARLEPAMRHVASGSPVTVGDLAGLLDADGRLVLVRRLVVEGLLEVVG